MGYDSYYYDYGYSTVITAVVVESWIIRILLWTITLAILADPYSYIRRNLFNVVQEQWHYAELSFKKQVLATLLLSIALALWYYAESSWHIGAAWILLVLPHTMMLQKGTIQRSFSKRGVKIKPH